MKRYDDGILMNLKYMGRQISDTMKNIITSNVWGSLARGLFILMMLS